MPDYSKSKIYKLVSSNLEDIYIGSTTLRLCSRKAGHINAFKNWKNGKGNYVSSFKIIENNEFDIILLEEYPCENKEQLHARERHYIENNKCVNMIIPNRKPDEYRKVNAESIANNRCKNREKNNQYYHDNKEKIEMYRENNKEILKQKRQIYRENNKEKLAEAYSIWYENNKDKRKEYNKQYQEKLKIKKSLSKVINF